MCKVITKIHFSHKFQVAVGPGRRSTGRLKFLTTTFLHRTLTYDTDLESLLNSEFNDAKIFGIRPTGQKLEHLVHFKKALTTKTTRWSTGINPLFCAKILTQKQCQQKFEVAVGPGRKLTGRLKLLTTVFSHSSRIYDTDLESLLNSEFNGAKIFVI